MAKIHFWDSSNRPAWVPVGPDQPEVLVGRRKDCTIRTENSAVSRLHCRVVYNGGIYLLEDQKSANGTFVDEKRVSRIELADNTKFKCGDFELKFELDEHERAALQRASIVFHQDPDDDEYVEINDAPKIVGKPAAPTTADYSEDRAPNVASQFGPSSLLDYVNQSRQPSGQSVTSAPVDDIIDVDDELVESDAAQEEAEQSLSSLTAEVQRLKALLRAAEDQIDMRNVELSSLNSTLEDMRFVDEELDKAKDTIAALQAQLAARPGETMELAVRVSDLEAKLAETMHVHEQQMQQAAERIAFLESQNAQPPQENELEELRREVEQLRHELAHGEHAELLDRLKLERDRLSANQDQLMAERDNLEAQINAINDQLVQALEDNDLIRAELDDEREARSGDAQTLLESITKKEADLRRDLDGARFDVNRLTAENVQLKAVIQEVRDQLSTESKTLTHQVLDLEKQLHEATVALADVSTERDATKMALDQALTDLARLQLQHNSILQDVDRTHENLAQQLRASEEARQIAADATQSRAAVEAQLAAVTEQLSRVSADHKLALQRAEQHDSDAAALRDALERVRRELADAPDKAAAEKLRLDYEKLQREHLVTKQHEDALKIQLAELQASVDDLKKQSAASKVLQEALVKAKTDLQQYQKQNEELTRRLREFEESSKAIEDARETNTKLREDNERAHEKLKTTLTKLQDAETQAQSLKQEVDAARAALNEAEKQRRAEIAAITQQLEAARKTIAETVANEAASAANERAGIELEAVRTKLSETENRLKAVTTEYETIKQAHTTQVRRYAQLLEQLKGAKSGDVSTPVVDPDVHIWKEKAEKLQADAQKAMADLRSVQQQLELLQTEKLRSANELIAAKADRDAAFLELETQSKLLASTKEKLSELTESVTKLRESQNTSVVVAQAPRGNEELVRIVKDLYQRMNDLASAWRNGMLELSDYLADLKERTTDVESIEMMEASVATCQDVVVDMKNVLRDFRTTLDGFTP